MQLEIYTATHLPPHFNTRISVQLRFAQDKFTVPLFYAASKRHCIWKRQGKNNSCTPKSLSLSRFSMPLATARVVGGEFIFRCKVLRRTVSCAGHPLPVWCSAPRHLQNILPSSHCSDKALACGTGAVWYSTCGVDFLAMRMPLLCKEA